MADHPETAQMAPRANRNPSKPASRPRRRRTCRPWPEALEGRTLLTAYTFTKIADGANLGFELYSTQPAFVTTPSLNNSGTAAFLIGLSGTGSEAVLTADGGSLTKVVDNATPLHHPVYPTLGYPNPFNNFGNPVIGDTGTTVFEAGRTSGAAAVYAGRVFDSTIDPLTGNPVSPSPVSPDHGFIDDEPTINSSGAIAWTDGVRLVGDDIFLQIDTSPFRTFWKARILDTGLVAFSATTDVGTAGIFTTDAAGNTRMIAETTSTSISPGTVFSINNNEVIAFRYGNTGIYTTDGVTTHPVAVSGGAFNTLNYEPAINDSGEVAFTANLISGGSGIFTGPDPVADKVIKPGDPLDGSTVVSALSGGFALNDAGQIAFMANLADGRQVLFRADPIQTIVGVNDITVNEGDSGTTEATFTVGLSAPSTQTITVNYATADGTAMAPGDYAATSGTLTFAPGVTSLPVTVPVSGDRMFEQDETFVLNLSSPTNATIADAQGVATITNDDPRLSIAIDDVTLPEGDAGTAAFTFTVGLSNPSDQPVTVNYTSADGTATTAGNDYVAASGTLTFAPGQTMQQVTVSVNGDKTSETDETFVVNLDGATGAIVADSQGVGTITNDDPLLSIAISDVTLPEGDAGTMAFTFTVSLSNPSDQPITVNYATADGTATTADNDYADTGGTLTFDPGQTVRQITVPVNGDKTFETDETFVVNLDGATGAIVADSQGVGTITNDDPPPLVIRRVTINDGGAQRSNIESITIAFSQGTNLAALIDDGTIVQAVQVFGTSRVPLGASRYRYNSAARTLTIDLTTDGFGGSRTTLLADGRYQLRLATALISSAGSATNTLQDTDGTADGTYRFAFRRLQGDFDGDATVSSADQDLFLEHYGSRVVPGSDDYLYDLNGDGAISLTDYLMFRRLLGRSV